MAFADGGGGTAGYGQPTVGVFSYISVEERVPKNHPLRGIRAIVDAAFQNLDDPVWDHLTFSKNRDRLIEVDIARRLMLAVAEHARGKVLVSEEHFSVDGTLIEARASHKSFRPKDEEPPTGGSGRNPEVDFHGERRINDTHASRTDPESRLYRKAKSKEAKLCYAGHALMENRNGFVVDGRANQMTGTAEAALAMVNTVPGEQAIAVSGDKGFDTADFVSGLTAAKATPHIARNTTNRERAPAVPEEIAATEGYAASQRFRKRIGEAVGWGKSIGKTRKAKVRGLQKVD